MTKPMKIITALINIISGMASFCIIIIVIAMWDGLLLFGARVAPDYDRTWHWLMLSGVAVSYFVINLLTYLICHRIKKEIKISEFIRFSLVPAIILNIILFIVVYTVFYYS